MMATWRRGSSLPPGRGGRAGGNSVNSTGGDELSTPRDTYLPPVAVYVGESQAIPALSAAAHVGDR